MLAVYEVKRDVYGKPTSPFAAAFVNNTRWSGDVIRRTGKKNFNVVSHNRARP